ncbi:hypothetical protein SDC9_85205 [bioreactor metagenome]|uniref:Riboflavin synthase subunit beta n=1 Tax=bioreactor metagenome TaxID=1076179 RepID=A0A644ZCH4_9ZZZZ
MSFFKLHKPLVYKYKPIYYDPKKEALKSRQSAKDDAEIKVGDGTFKSSIRRGSFREMAEKNRNSKDIQNRQSNVRLIIIILILFIIAYFLLK